MCRFQFFIVFELQFNFVVAEVKKKNISNLVILNEYDKITRPELKHWYKYWLAAVSRDVLMNNEMLTAVESPPPRSWQNKEISIT